MTTPIEALTYISNARWNENADLDDICTMADRALASLEGDAVERVARYGVHYDVRGEFIHPQGDFVHWSDYQRLAQRYAILATGLVAGEAERPLGDVFNELVRRMNFDGMDPRTFTLGELERAIDGAEFPK